MAVSSLDREAGTVAVIGGHLPGGAPVLCAGEDGVKTPLGTMKIDCELREAFKKQASLGSQPVQPDRYQDNTVEVLLPMVHYFFPRADLLWLRFPADPCSFDAGKILAESAAKLGRRIVVLASTDLTHYGENYGFSPQGRGKPALDWVKKVNDAAFIAAVLDGDPSRVLKHAEEDSSACSAGAVLGALGFAACQGRTKARLLDYCTSADAGQADEGEIPDSFVGYAAIAAEWRH
jgi:AmmeMemoRadiSam system protein B